MLLTADKDFVDDDAASAAASSPSSYTLQRIPKASGAISSATDRYGARKSASIPVIASVLLVHALLIGALMQMRHNYVRHKEARMEVVNLMPPPAPPPAEETPPPPSLPQVVAPPPIIQTPVPPMPQMVTTPEPVPVRSVLAVAPAPVAPTLPSIVIAGPSTVQLGDLTTRMLSGKPPRYPLDSRKLREQGTVVLALTLGLDGYVSSVAIAQSSGFSRLDNAARDAVKRWRWAPTIRGGQPVIVKGVVEIPFVLKA